MTLSEARIRQLIEEARAGDNAASGSLIGAMRDQMLRWALVVTGDLDDAEDVTQQVSIILHRRIAQYESKSRFTTWLYTIVRNTAVTMKRSRARHAKATIDEDAIQIPEARLEDHISRMNNQRMADLVRSFFNELAPRQREMIELVDQKGFSAVEAAEVLGIAPETARVHLLRARRTLRSKMLERHAEVMG